MLLVVAFVVYLFAAVLAFGWVGSATLVTVLGLIAVGLALTLAQSFRVPRAPRQ